MEPTDNPYSVLGVSPGASARDIRTAYRKAALQHHPDKKSDAYEKERAHAQFAKISAAYEMLTETTDGGSGVQPSQQHSRQPQSSYPTRFHDPFDVFEHVFREEFGNPNNGFGSNSNYFPSHRNPHRSIFDMDDPFGDDGIFPSFGRSGPFFGGRSLFDSPMFRDHDDVFASMREQMKKLEEGSMSNGNDKNGESNGNKRMFSSASSSSSTSSLRQANGDTVTTTKRTQTVNGKTQQVTERVVYGADGSVKERQVTGDDALLESAAVAPRLGGWLLPSNRDQQHEHQEHPRDPPPSSWWRRQRPAIRDDNDPDQNSRL